MKQGQPRKNAIGPWEQQVQGPSGRIFGCGTLDRIHTVSELHPVIHFFVPPFVRSFIREMPAEHLLCAGHSASCWGYGINKPDTLRALPEFEVWQEKGWQRLGLGHQLAVLLTHRRGSGACIL